MSRFENIRYIQWDTIGSTQDWAKAHAHTLPQTQVSCVTAREQTAGRGRWHRRWVSPRDQNIYASIYFCVPQGWPHLPNLGQVLSLSCAMVLKEKGFDPQIKWPNDLLLVGKKVAGVLSEVVNFEDRLGVVLGIGLNVNMTQEMLEEIDQPATSLAEVSGRCWDIRELLELVLRHFLRDLEILETGGFAAFQPAYERLLAYKGQEITCYDGVQPVKGICHSISPDGTLNLELFSGEKVKVSTGEVQISRKSCPE